VEDFEKTFKLILSEGTRSIMVVSSAPMYNIFNVRQETIKLRGFPSRLLVYAPKDKQAKAA